MIKFRITLTGTAPLLMHNSRLANPLDPIVKEMKRITSKKKTKTDEDLEELYRLEFVGGLYYEKGIGPILPGENIWSCIFSAAKKQRMGPRVKEGVQITTDINPLAYNGPRDIDGLWADENFRLEAVVRNQQSRIVRTRPMFREWKADAEGIMDPNILDFADLQQFAETAGTLIGMGDWRPRYGRFDVTLEKVK